MVFVLYSLWFEGRCVLQYPHALYSMAKVKLGQYIDIFVKEFEKEATTDRLTFHLIAEGETEVTECDIVIDLPDRKQRMLNWKNTALQLVEA